MKRCMYCGQVNDDANTTCSKCGNPLLETPVEDGTEQEMETGDTLTEEEDFRESDLNPNVTRAAYMDGEVTYEEEPAGAADFSFDDDVRSYGFEDEENGFDEPVDDGEAYEPAYDSRYDADDYDDYDDYDDETPRSMNALMTKSRKRVKSFLFFLSTFCFSVFFAAQILNIVLGSARVNLSTVSHTLEKQFGSNSIITLMNTLIGLLDNFTTLQVNGVALALMIPELLMFFGLWGMFSATSRRRIAISTTGYSLTRAGLIIRFIEACFVLLAVIVVTVSFVVAAAASGSTMSLIVGVVLLLIAVIAAVLVIMFFVQVIFSVRAVKRNVKVGESIGRIPGYVIFCGLILTIFTAVSLLPMAPDDYIGLIATGAKAVWLLLITLWAIIYRATVKEEQ